MMDSQRDFFEKLAPEWDSHQPSDRESTLHALFSLIDTEIQTGDLLLDVGTGTGAVIPILKKRYPKTKVVSIDLAWEMLRRARQRELTASLVLNDVHALPFEKHSFSTVVCHNSFPHFQNKLTALSEFKRVLEEQGKLIILHDLNRKKVNQIHQCARSKTIHQDLLPAGNEMQLLLKKSGFGEFKIQDAESYYLVIARVLS
jgi:ubiquinone/menaquinone biosynthesis C-methylase UbiE